MSNEAFTFVREEPHHQISVQTISDVTCTMQRFSCHMAIGISYGMSPSKSQFFEN